MYVSVVLFYIFHRIKSHAQHTHTHSRQWKLRFERDEIVCMSALLLYIRLWWRRALSRQKNDWERSSRAATEATESVLFFFSFHIVSVFASCLCWTNERQSKIVGDENNSFFSRPLLWICVCVCVWHDEDKSFNKWLVDFCLHLKRVDRANKFLFLLLLLLELITNPMSRMLSYNTRKSLWKVLL